jgi:hypothetical protein
MYWDMKITLLFNMKIKKITTFFGKRSTNQVQAPLLLLQVHHSHAFLSQPTDILGKGKGLYKEKGLEGNAEAKSQKELQNLG